MKQTALIVAGGRGTRMQSDLPKQFMLLLDVPVLMHTIERFAMALPQADIVLVLPEDQIKFWNGLCAQMDFDIEHKIVGGGSTRFGSVKNGLDECHSEGIVGIHDGVRPLVSTELIQSCFQAAAEKASAVPCVPVAQSLRKRQGNDSAPVDRTGMLAVQTPQCFDVAKLKAAYSSAEHNQFTDDATVWESAGHSVHIVAGEATNLKITTMADLHIAESLLSRSQ